MTNTHANGTPIRALVVRFSYDAAREIMENVLRTRPFEFCAQIAADNEVPRMLTSIPENDQDFFLSAKIRGCEYEGVDWNTLTPVDEELLEQMRDTEAIFMDTVARLEWKRMIPYATRKRWYLRHLQFWNDYLTKKKINLYLSAWIPHEVPDVLLYRLCRLRGIPTLFFQPTLVPEISFPCSTWEDPAPALHAAYEKLLPRYAGVKNPAEIPLEPLFEKRYQSLATEQAERPGVENVRRATEADKIKSLAKKKPLAFLSFGLRYLTPEGMTRLHGMWQRRSIIKKRNAFYDAHAIRPDMEKRFVYLPLHFQPEASTTPLAGAFTDQAIVAQMLDACLPDDVLIYVKEHPRDSGWMKRDARDYADLLAIKKVRLVARDVDTFALREKCTIVATCSGSAGFEALFRQKPVLLFGSRFYQYADGVFRIHTAEDCRRAVRKILEEGAAPDIVKTRIFMKAMEEAGIRGILHPLHLKISGMPAATHVTNLTKAILDGIAALQPEIAAAAR